MRPFIAFAAAVVVFAGAVVYTFSKQPQFRATAQLLISGQSAEPNPMQGNTPDRAPSEPNSPTSDTSEANNPDLTAAQPSAADRDRAHSADFNTQVAILSSQTLRDQVADRIYSSVVDRGAFLAPFSGSGDRETPSVAGILAENTRVEPIPSTKILAVTFQHPDPEVAARVANLIVDEYIEYGVRQQIETTMLAVEELRIRVAQQRERLRQSTFAVEDFREINELTGDAEPETPEQRTELRMLEGDRQIQMQVHAAMEKRLQQEMARIQMTGPTARVVDPATPPAEPVTPNLPVHLGVGLAGAVVVFALGCLLSGSRPKGA